MAPRAAFMSHPRRGLADFELFSEVDEDGFVALVCPDTYLGYIDEDWTPEQLTEHCLGQMNAQALFIAHPGPQLACEPLRIANNPSPLAASWEASNVLHVGKSGLWITDYVQLTMAAQFNNERPVAGYHTCLPVQAGMYRVTLRQVATQPAIEVIIQEANACDRRCVLSAIRGLESGPQ